VTQDAFEAIVGPRVPDDEMRRHRARYVLPSSFLAAAAVLLLVSLFQPYWRMILHAPQYPKGLTVRAYLNRLEGDVAEIDGLNHYIGMRKLNEAAKLERQLSIMAVAAVSLLVLGAIFIHNRRAAWLALPALLFPAGFLFDLHLWLAHFGRNLDPHAPLSSSIKPFTPPVLGTGYVGQFSTVAAPDWGLLLAFAASATILAGLWLHRRAYKPLVDAAMRGAAALLVATVLSTWGATGARAGTLFDLREAILAAEPGATIRVPSGVHRGSFVLDKRVALEGEPGAILEGSGDGDVLRITAAHAAVRGLTVRGTGVSLDKENAGILVMADDVTIEHVRLTDVLFGVYARQANRLVVRDNTVTGKDFDVTRRGDSIRLWYCDDGIIEGNRVSHARDVVVWFSRRTKVLRNEVRDSRYGLHLMYADQTDMEDNRLEANSVGAFLMYSNHSVFSGNRVVACRGPSGYGLGLKDNDALVAEHNEFVGNRVGIYVDNSPNSIDSRCTMGHNLVAYNDVGIGFLPAVERNDVSSNAFVDNLEQVGVIGPGDFHGNAFTVDGRGNYWSDYRGYDLDGDGVGDLPYRSVSLFENLMDRHAELRLFQFSPVQQAVDLAVRAFPVVRPRPKLTDTAPLMRSMPARSFAGARPLRAPFAALSAALLLAFSGAAAWARREPVPPPGPVSARHPILTVAQETPLHAMLAVIGVTKRFRKFTAVDDVSFEIAPGEAVALWGPNGAGKSTLLKCLLGLLRFTGAVRIDGHDALSEAKIARGRLGYVPQELAFYPEWTGNELLAFVARIRRVASERVDVVLAQVGLAAHGAKPIGSLSGGMKQRLALAAALLSDPPLLVLDEITSNLDANGRDGLLRVLARLKESGKTIVFTSHRRDDVIRLADRVLVLERGRLVRHARPWDVQEAEADAMEDLA
jgi:nitrous oxidase accessory protein/Cu-processing system ATP-binding protein